MIIYLKHKTHGTHVAYSETDAKVCEKSGWVRFVPDVVQPPKIDINKIDADSGPIFTNTPPRRGRPPRTVDDEPTIN